MSKTYQIPLKIDGIVKRNEQEIREKLAQAKETGCPLQGYIDIEVMVNREPREEIPTTVNKDGCYVLRDPICYLKDGSRRRGKDKEPQIPKISCREECLVYQRVKRLLSE